MSGKAGGKGGPAKNPKKTKQEPDDDDLLEDLVAESDPKKTKKPMTYANLKPGGFVTKAEDRKGRLEKRRAKQETKDDDEDDDNDDEKTEQEKLEREAGELTSQLKKAERAEAQTREKDQKDKAKCYSQRITSGRFLKQARAVTLVETKKRKKLMKMGDIASAEEEDDPDDIPEGFHLQEESPHCINMKRADNYQAYLRHIILEFERLIKSGATNISEEYGKLYRACSGRPKRISRLY